MFDALNLKGKVMFLCAQLVMVLMIILLAWQSHKWSAEAAKEQLQRKMWQSGYLELTDQVNAFNQKQQALLQEIAQLKQHNQQTTKELHNALQNNQDWSNQPVPDDIKRVFGTADNR